VLNVHSGEPQYPPRGQMLAVDAAATSDCEKAREVHSDGNGPTQLAAHHPNNGINKNIFLTSSIRHATNNN
jgi:hypothetical protein